MQIHHAGYIVHDAEDTSLFQEKLHRIASVFDPLQEATICLYRNQHDGLIELIQPLNEKSPVWNFLQKNGSRFHHHCYQGKRNEIEKYIADNQLTKIMGPLTAKIFDPSQVEFYIDKNSNITEFIFQHRQL